MRIATIFSLFAIVLLASCGKSTTPNGYEYETLAKGSGIAPKPTDYAFVHIYVMYDDSLVNSTRNAGQMMPIIVPDLANMKPEDLVNGKPNPIQDLLGLMSVGDSVSVVVPIDEQMRTQNPTLAGVNKLAYEVVLHEVKTADEFVAAQQAERENMAGRKKATQLSAPGQEGVIGNLVDGIATQYKAGELDAQIKTTASGLKYMMVEEGKGAKAEAGKTVDVNYYGVLTDGVMFDNSFGRGQPISFPLGQGAVIKGWDEGIGLLKTGSKAVLFIPSELAYGPADKGTIPPNSELIFYVELVGVK